jgi:putative transposase
MRESKHRLSKDAYRGQVTVSITACIQHRRTPFVDGGIVGVFVDLLRHSIAKRYCEALIYCFMPDHLHVVFHGKDDDADTWQAMVDFKQKSGYWFGRCRPEFCWQKDFHDHVVRSSEDLGVHIRYIADNPVRLGLAAAWDQYPYTGSLGVDLRSIMEDTATI